ncbi:Zinc dependent phospholipase C [Peptoclostridium litorale DSM 5388]|uniref:Phospholipase C/D domain-containing protein n=1 Tax=Peptoclostridium litorale DSM 5388 TaxID=1121324 RepID=A0A069RGW5_PEPLI|nr:zinc dependent phospholipase C family protein [Peptoclostridium litorale]KDR96028.1 hypothetical protein CLIT_5c00390 [Peptoclostridium litorale DSM 5388]SIO06303.1 Zinc dependent phospholipase C [Peptoclostridium litorale DSM 5388]
MLAQTHKIIGSHLHDNIEKKTGIKLNRNLLIYGSIKPDIWPTLAVKKHYKDKSFGFVIDEIESLMALGLHDNPISINRFSVKLGIITHFLSDFFCLPHHDRDYFHDKLKEHLTYEKRLHDSFKAFSGLKNVNMPYMDGISRQNIIKFIEELHLEYKDNPAGYINDVRGSINVSSAIGILVSEHSVVTSKSLQKAAGYSGY